MGGRPRVGRSRWLTCVSVCGVVCFIRGLCVHVRCGLCVDATDVYFLNVCTVHWVLVAECWTERVARFHFAAVLCAEGE